MFPHPTLRRGAALLAVAACCLAVGACGGSESEGSSATDATASSSNDRDAARVRLQECLRENGIDVPDQGGAGPGGLAGQDIDQAELDAAMEACDEYRQNAFGDITDEDLQEAQDAFTRFSQCMRDEGIDVPDVEFGGGGPPAGGLRQLDQDDPDVQAAREKCQDELPQGLGRGGG